MVPGGVTETIWHFVGYFHNIDEVMKNRLVYEHGGVSLRPDDKAAAPFADKLYASLTEAGVETLYDDVDERPGAKFAAMDLIGLPWQIIVGPRGVKAGTVELKERKTGKREDVSHESALARMTQG